MPHRRAVSADRFRAACPSSSLLLSSGKGNSRHRSETFDLGFFLVSITFLQSWQVGARFPVYEHTTNSPHIVLMLSGSESSATAHQPVPMVRPMPSVSR